MIYLLPFPVDICILIWQFLFTVALSLCCCPWAFIGSKQGLLLLRFMGFSWRWFLLLRNTHSRVHRPSCSESPGIFRDQGLNLCPLYWQTDSYPLCHQESLVPALLVSTNITVAQKRVQLSGKSYQFCYDFTIQPYPKWPFTVPETFDFSLYESKTAAL